MDFCYAHGNDAAVALAEHTAGSIESFANLMNKKAEELKLKDTHFVTPHGLDEEEHYTTAYELAVIANYALNIDKIAQIVKTKTYTVSINNSSKNLKNTNELLGYLDGVYGVKTGFTNGANRCLVTSVKRDNMDIICVVLGADTKKDRTQDSIKLIEYTYSNFKMIDLKFMIEDEFDDLVETSKFNVIKGINNDVQLGLEENNISLYPVKKDNIKDVIIEKEIQNELISPVEKNTEIGKLRVKIEDKIIYELGIYTKNDIPKKNVFDYYKEFIYNMYSYLSIIQ